MTPARLLLMALALGQVEPHPTGPPCRWAQRVVTVRSDLDFPSINRAECRAVLARTCAAWSSVCGLELIPTEGDANIAVGQGPLDGTGFVLARSHFPCSAASGRIAILFDVAEPWTPDRLERTLLHELGHAIGLVHDGAGSGDAMAPYVTPSSPTTPSRRDARHARLRYGPPREQHTR